VADTDRAMELQTDGSYWPVPIGGRRSGTWWDPQDGDDPSVARAASCFHPALHYPRVRRGSTWSSAGSRCSAIEVKSGRAPDALPGMAAFSAAFHPSRTLLVGGDGIDIDTCLTRPVRHWL